MLFPQSSNDETAAETVAETVAELVEAPVEALVEAPVEAPVEAIEVRPFDMLKDRRASFCPFISASFLALDQPWSWRSRANASSMEEYSSL